MNDGGRSRTISEEFHLRDGSNSNEKAHVGDLVNCGPRHQFLIRNKQGEVFVSHNSMGHGLNLGLGSNLVWFGRNWSLELTNQFNGRLTGGHRRKGRVTQHYLLAKDTMDIAVHSALVSKATTQKGLKKAVREYQRSKS